MPAIYLDPVGAPDYVHPLNTSKVRVLLSRQQVSSAFFDSLWVIRGACSRLAIPAAPSTRSRKAIMGGRKGKHHKVNGSDPQSRALYANATTLFVMVWAWMDGGPWDQNLSARPATDEGCNYYIIALPH
jgi:hypothetical protein